MSSSAADSPSNAPSSNPPTQAASSHSYGQDAWRNEHPYRKPNEDSSDGSFTTYWQGACHCGQIRYSLGREKPLASKYCHCGDCQTMHAVSSQLFLSFLGTRELIQYQAPFQWAAIFHKSDLRFHHGTQGLTFYSPTLHQPTHSLPCKVYCATCHTPIMDEGRNMVMLFPELIRGIRHSKEAKEAFRIHDHICWPSRVVDDGVFIGDGVRKWIGVDGKSEEVKEDRNS